MMACAWRRFDPSVSTEIERRIRSEASPNLQYYNGGTAALALLNFVRDSSADA